MVSTDDILKEGAVLKPGPLSEQQLAEMLEGIRIATEGHDRSHIQKWDEKTWLELNRPMSI